jgi:biopolymer transport protein ExbD
MDQRPMIKRKKRAAAEVNASSMADIAFLLLIFFIITSNVVNDSGTRLILPIKQEPQPVKTEEQNVCSIIMNSKDQFLVNGDEMNLDEIPTYVVKFVTNRGRDPKMSDSPDKAVVVLKTSRGSSYNNYVSVINKVQQVYFEQWAQLGGVGVEELLSWDVDQDPELSQKLDDLRAQFPYNFIIAEQEL